MIRSIARQWSSIAIACVMVISAGSAKAFHDPVETLSELKSGENYFSAHAGDVVMIRAQSSGGNTTCYPEITSSEGLERIGQVNRHLNDRAAILQINQDGTYSYSLPLPLDETGSCSITVGPLTSYEHLMMDAADLERQIFALYSQPAQQSQTIDLMQRSLALYQQAIALEPQYPEPYERSISLLFGIHIPPDFLETAFDLNDLGALFLSLPETVRAQLINHYTTLAQIYETSPEWQTNSIDSVEILQAFAEFIRTGQPSETMEKFFTLID
ncbi:MAG: hypothetical protein AAF821_16765 [Cyanobacteria bacterium P01_D01_bin.156]